MEGAAVLAAHAALRVGSGFVGWVQAHDSRAELSEAPSVMRADRIDDIAHRVTAYIIGPGLRPHTAESARAWDLLTNLTRDPSKPVVLDAGGLSLLAEDHSKLKLGSHFVLTPHAGEAARLLNTTSAWIDENRETAALQLHQKFHSTIVLKGHRTLIVFKGLKSKVFVVEVSSGGPQLAKAGTGDVLSGMIGGFAAQMGTIRVATMLGVYSHGAISDEWVLSGNAPMSMEPMDIIEAAPQYFSQLIKNHEQ